jgi:hypothetical protein
VEVEALGEIPKEPVELVAVVMLAQVLETQVALIRVVAVVVALEREPLAVQESSLSKCQATLLRPSQVV